MKKIYLSAVLLGITASSSFGQIKTDVFSHGRLNQPSNIKTSGKTVKPVAAITEKAILWTEDFDIGTTSGATAGPTFTTSNGVWTTGGADGNIWKHTFASTSGEWSTGSPAFASTTSGNGFMLFDADSVNFPITPNYLNYTGELISPSIDLTTAGSAQLIIEQDFRWCCAGTQTITVSVSSDAGATWGTPHNLIPATVATNDGFSTTTGSFIYATNISGEAAGNTIMLKFIWDGNDSGSAHYYWNIDDINIETLPPDDVQNLASWISGENNSGLEYGRTPEDQQDANWLVGSQVYNYGANDQTNVTMTADFVSFSSVGVDALLEADSTVIIENSEALALTPGVYAGTYTVVSDAETGGALFTNNVNTREFEITNPSTSPMTVYSQDGIGVYATTNLSSIGTDSFAGGEDGLVCASLYHIKQTSNVSAIRVMLATGTQADAEVYGSILDTADFWAGNISPLFATNSATITGTHIAQGYVDLTFPATVSLAAGVYYAGVEMYSAANTNDMIIVDDETVPQPNDASAIYIPGDQSYTNGTAFGIRLLMGDFAGIDENTLSGVSIYPNPSEGVITVTNVNGSANSIVVYDMLGKVVLTKDANTSTTLDLASNGTGIYMVKVSNENGSVVERVVIK